MEKINQALSAAGHLVCFFKGEGYFYFIETMADLEGKYHSIPSIYQSNMEGLTPEYIVKYVEDHINE